MSDNKKWYDGSSLTPSYPLEIERLLREIIITSITEMKAKAKQQSLCNLGRGKKDGLEDAAYILQEKYEALKGNDT